MVRERIDQRQQGMVASLWEFNEDGMRYKDDLYDLYYKWPVFKGYRIVEDNIFIMLSERFDQSFVIGKKELEQAVCADRDGNVYVLDQGNNAIRKVCFK